MKWKSDLSTESSSQRFPVSEGSHTWCSLTLKRERLHSVQTESCHNDRSIFRMWYLFLTEISVLENFCFSPSGWQLQGVLWFQWGCEDTEKLSSHWALRRSFGIGIENSSDIFMVGSRELTHLCSSWIAQQGPPEDALSSDVLIWKVRCQQALLGTF